MIGRAPASVKPDPVTVALLTVTGALPVEVRVRYWVAIVPSPTLPKSTLLALALNVCEATSNCRTKPVTTPFELADTVTFWGDVTFDTVAVNPAFVLFAGTITLAGTETAALLLERFTVTPLFDAGALSNTVQASVPAPVKVELLQNRELNTPGTGSPVPLSPMTIVGFVEELLPTVS